MPRTYHKVTEEVILNFIEEKHSLVREVYENGMSVNAAGRKLGLKRSTAKLLIKKYR
jgi:transposase-like protein